MVSKEPRSCWMIKITVCEEPSIDTTFNASSLYLSVSLPLSLSIIVVGGDGFYSEVLTGLVLRQQQLAGLNPHDPDVEVSQLPVPVGVVPGGTGNFVANYLYGSKDPVTAAINILIGKTLSSNVVGVYQGGKLEGCAGLICSFGLFGEMMHECEKHRWMGNFRYKVIPIHSILSRRKFPGRVEYLHAPSGEWRQAKGQFYAFDLNVVDLVDNGEALIPTFGPEANILHITSECSLGDHIKGLKKVEDWATGAYDYPFIKNEPVHRLRVSLDSTSPPGDTAEIGSETEDKPLEGITYYINCDGEALPITRTQFQMKVHPNLVKLFGEHAPR
ncbi:ceramide kinase [Plakobranchus ocellatus]|uniref:Ceramide kinase n=1 Tax=Plakobranchus ocellatus TaxID=259542 RepID=A0AAV4BKT8_9GAST|nr:ceramide kinase [Plakobranchus ocellatus]